MNKKIGIWISILAAVTAWSMTLIAVSYGWGYDQCAIDHKAAYFSHPAYLNLINGIPGIFAVMVFLGLAFYLCRKK